MRLRLLSQLQEPSLTPSGTEPRAVHQDFWRIELSDLERELGAGAGGLSSAEAAARRVRFGANTLGERQRHSITLKFLSRFRNALVLILLVAALISALTGDVTSFIIISTIVLMSAMLGDWFGFTRPSLLFLLANGGLVVCYLLLAQTVKSLFYRLQPSGVAASAPLMLPHFPLIGRS